MPQTDSKTQPGLPAHVAQHPKGWGTNPSSLKERALVVGLTIASLTCSGVSSSSTKQIYLPLLLALAALLSIAGSAKRWKTAPWLAILNGLVLGLFVFAGVARELVQMAMLNAWPVALLLEAATALCAIGASMDEVLAGAQYVREQGRLGRSPWRAFWGLSPRARRRGSAIKTM